ncbi:MAG: hypothetical protein WKF34_06800 [Pyrinomonadaceae bacterium]
MVIRVGGFFITNIKIGEVIASRSLTIKNADGKTSEFVVLIGKPCLTEGSSNFYAPYQFRGIGKENVKYAAGVDTVQAIQLAMVMIGAELDAINSKTGNNIRWECRDESGDFGFP